MRCPEPRARRAHGARRFACPAAAAPILGALLWALAAPHQAQCGETWRFRLPPAAVWREPVQADWRGFATLECDVRAAGLLSEAPVLCSVVIQNKQDLWIKAREPVRLDGTLQTIRLRLDELSPDWLVQNGARPFGADALRWVRAWGVELFCAGEASGAVEIGPPRLARAEPSPLRVLDVRMPDRIVAGATNGVRFRVAGFAGNPYRARDIRVSLAWQEGGTQRVARAYFAQDYAFRAAPDLAEVAPQPLESPCWRVDWCPRGACASNVQVFVTTPHAACSHPLGAIGLAPRAPSGTGNAAAGAPAARGRPAPGTAAAGMLRALPAGARLLEYAEDGRWREAEAGGPARDYWAADLDWTQEWDPYTGMGEYDQLTAWRLEQAIGAATGRLQRLLLAFDDDQIDDTGRLNWKDHPLNRANGGPLQRPFDLFRDPRSDEVTLDRARYLWLRYGRLPGVRGLLLKADRPEPAVTNWMCRMAADIARECRGARVFCNAAALLPREKSVPLDETLSWVTDRELSAVPATVEVEPGERPLLECQGTGTVGIVSRSMQHWLTADNFACDILTPPDCGNTLTVACFLRTDPDTVFMSDLVPLREGDDNRVVFPLKRQESWRCLRPGEPRPLSEYDLLNIREVGLRFFSQAPVRISARIGNATLNWPYAADAVRRPPLELSRIRAVGPEVPAFGKFEVDFDINRRFRNPYDPAEIDAAIEIEHDAGGIVRHPAYFHEPYELAPAAGRERAVRGGAPFWRARVTLSRPGEYRWRVVAKAGAERATLAGRIRCVPGSTRGFVGISRSDPRYLEFANGEFYYPIGLNLRSPSDSRAARLGNAAAQNAALSQAIGTAAYERWFTQMECSGADFARVWMSPWWCGLEWNERHEGFHGMGYYNQANAARLDRIVELAERHDIHLCLETMNHGALSTRIDADWQLNPMNAAQPGGFLRSPSEFFVNPRAQEMHRNKLRYTVARWGYSTAIAWWGVITEAEWVQPYDRTLYNSHPRAARPPFLSDAPEPMDPKQAYVEWISATAGYIKRLDAHPHLTSVHFSNPQNGTEVWSLPNLDVVHNNAYSSFANFWRQEQFETWNGVADVYRVFCREYAAIRAGKPLMIGEWGGHPVVNTETHLISELHTGLWASLMTSTSGDTGFWWWNLVDGRNLFPEFAAVARFMKGEDRRGRALSFASASVFFPPSGNGAPAADTVERPGEGRRGLVLYGRGELYAYVFHEAMNRNTDSAPASGSADRRFPQSGEGRLRAPAELGNGTYRVEYWDTFAGKITGTASVRIGDGERTIPIPSHRVDLALKMKPSP